MISEIPNSANSDKLIVALDFSNIEKAKALVNELGDSVNFYKIGLELAMSGDYFELVKWLEIKNKKVFCDLKLFDISKTVGKAVKNLNQYQNIHFLTIHAGSHDIMRKAVENKGKIKILAVTVLTNLDQNDLTIMGCDPKLSLEDLVLKRAKLAKECGIDGVVCSGLEAKSIRQELGKTSIIVTPSIRLTTITDDDQKRVVDVKTALTNGANYIVVGRPINQSPNPKQTAEEFQQEILKSV